MSLTHTNALSSPHSKPVARLGAALASMSNNLMPLMAQHGIRMKFSAPSAAGLVIADATRNPTAAYKVRGALAGASSAKTVGKASVCTVSAGNHGAGLAYAAKLLGLHAEIFVPENAPKVKTDKIESFGAAVTRIGDTFDACLAATRAELATKGRQSSFVHPFDEQAVVAGQGTIGIEILRHALELNSCREYSRIRIFVPVGGGGLAGGIASVVKNGWPQHLPTPEIIGVIDESSPASLLGTYFGRPVRAVPDTIADGTRVALVGNTFVSLAPLIDRILLIPHDELVDTMRTHFEATGDRLEASGALALAGAAFARRLRLLDNDTSTLSFAVISGRNVDEVVFRDTLLHTSPPSASPNIRCAYDVSIPEKAGQLRLFLAAVTDYNITGLTYKQSPGSTHGTLRVDFDVAKGSLADLEQRILGSFPGSAQLGTGQHALLQVGNPVASRYRDELVTLEDTPGSFLRYIEQLSTPDALGSVGFLFYRKPAIPGSRAQVVLGRDRVGHVNLTRSH